MLKSSKAKGSRLEYIIRDKLRESGLDKYANRAVMSGGTWVHKEDVVTKLPLFIECKNREAWQPHKWYQDTLSRRPSARLTPVLVLKANRTPIYALLDIDDLISILAYALAAGWPDKELDNT